MPRCIDADAFEESCRERYCKDCDNYNGGKCRACWVDDMLGEVDEAPTVSDDEVRGAGEWERSECEDGKFWANYCSLCFAYLPYGLEWKPKYCPSCGAKMEVSDDA